MIERKREIETVLALLRRHPVVGLIGARQVGKTTLARHIERRFGGPSVHFDLESPEDLSRLSDPVVALKDRKGLVIIDEVQRAPNLFSFLRVLADRPGTSARFLVLGSASPALLRQTAETLAGRIIYHELGGFWLEETGTAHRDRLWIRGGLPRSYLARTPAESFEWRREFLRTFLERDLPQLGIGISTTTLRRFWTMLAHWHGQIWNSAEFARSFGVADTTVRKYLDTLSAAMVVRLLMPWHENLAKRQVKSPKVYIRDTGLLHALLGQRTQPDLEGHPKAGASWEGFALDQVLRRTGALPEECHFWATHGGAELDLLIVRGRKRLGFEFKRTAAPSATTSMKIALADLRLDRLDVVHAGEGVYPLGARIRAVALEQLPREVGRLT